MVQTVPAPQTLGTHRPLQNMPPLHTQELATGGKTNASTGHGNSHPWRVEHRMWQSLPKIVGGSRETVTS